MIAMLRSVRIRLVRNTWERLARLDPYWAIINRPDWRQNRAELDEFFASGRALIERQMAQAATVSPEIQWGRAFDFGCGVGRLSAALATRFREVVGVDISARMIALARQHHAAVENLTFVRNMRADLQAFSPGSFDLVYSLITLQHLPPPLIRAYLCDFARICRPGGVLLFQLPSRELPRRRGNPWSLWPPTVATRLRRVFRRGFNRLVPINPVIDVHCLDPEEVRTILVSVGARVLAQWPDDSCGPTYESFLYLARKG